MFLNSHQKVQHGLYVWWNMRLVVVLTLKLGQLSFLSGEAAASSASFGYLCVTEYMYCSIYTFM